MVHVIYRLEYYDDVINKLQNQTGQTCVKHLFQLVKLEGSIVANCIPIKLEDSIVANCITVKLTEIVESLE